MFSVKDAQPESVPEPAIVDRQALQQSWCYPFQQDMDRSVESVDASAFISFADIVKQRGAQQVRIVLARFDEPGVDTQMVGAIEWRQRIQQLPLRVRPKQPFQFAIDDWIWSAAEHMPELAHAPEHVVESTTSGSRQSGSNRHRHQNTVGPTIVERRNS